MNIPRATDKRLFSPPLNADTGISATSASPTSYDNISGGRAKGGEDERRDNGERERKDQTSSLALTSWLT